jgi:hypothetical protein
VEAFESLPTIAKSLGIGISVETLRQGCARQENRLPHIRVGAKGGQIRARKSDVCRWLEQEVGQ